ncbi:hypothetical protein ACHAAC_17425 [Aeromicrobium sp. CF4.19]|uniref:hypothetical protein n=1 Tax=Aeromicrobium sp. CF4.19 TaxID=3373082 RepID=UPI003EE7AB53
MAAQRFADEQMRLLAETEIRAGDGLPDLKQALSQLPPEQVARMLGKFDANPSLLTGDALTGLGTMFGIERADGPPSLEARREI